MKKITIPFLMFLVFSLSSCAAIEGVFKAGYYVGIFVVVFILFVIGFIWAKVRK
ncbi:MAG TPA: phosphatidate cytidylyltransferase [Pelobium sp.]